MGLWVEDRRVELEIVEGVAPLKSEEGMVDGGLGERGTGLWVVGGFTDGWVISGVEAEREGLGMRELKAAL